ncbi:MAG: hypothetical protein AB2L07_21765 [Thermoanaerobaculaceae bacterium]
MSASQRQSTDGAPVQPVGLSRLRIPTSSSTQPVIANGPETMSFEAYGSPGLVGRGRSSEPTGPW